MCAQTESTIFPDGEFAHCPYCGSHEGMGLLSDRGRQFVQCICGARGRAIERADFTRDGRTDVAAMDAATRRAWNVRAGSNGTAEIEAKLLEAARRMNQYAMAGNRPRESMPHDSLARFVAELRMWSEYLDPHRTAPN